ncbi:MAG: flippase-like domain-containing protein [Cyclobacteriaceae bacterium]|nr:flippase-like domain-containing protein [Cyclobacteriaceae bacterium]
MSKSVRTVLQYIVMLALTAGLLWLSLRGLNVGEGGNKAEFIWRAWKEADKFYLIMMAVVAFASHVLRAERWKMMLVPTGNHIKLSNSFFSLMIGYLVNLAIPRGGEFSRCYNLYKLEDTPVEVSFGTVVVERLIDVLCLLVIILLAFLAEWDKLMAFLESLGIGKQRDGFSVPPIVFVGLAGIIVIGVLIFLFRKNEKLKKLFLGFKEGLLSVFQLKNTWLFVFYSIAIWLLYFLMSYCVIEAFETTNELGFGAVLVLFALGAIAMAAPLPGGAGSYHTIVPLGLVMLYALPQADAIAFVFIFHAWQTLTMIVGGVVSLIASYWIIRWRRRPQK